MSPLVGKEADLILGIRPPYARCRLKIVVENVFFETRARMESAPISYAIDGTEVAKTE